MTSNAFLMSNVHKLTLNQITMTPNFSLVNHTIKKYHYIYTFQKLRRHVNIYTKIHIFHKFKIKL